MATRRFALIHSPLVGPGAWRGVAEVLRARGAEVVTPSASVWGVARPDHAGVAEAIAGQLSVSDGPWVLVAHSAAGALLPAIVDSPGISAEGAVFADAVLPHPGQSWLETAPLALRAEVLSAARNGHARPWPEWFPPEVIARLLPEPAEREAFVAECAPIPFAYLAARAPTTRAWPLDQCAYLQLSQGYAAEAEAAGRHWPVERIPSHHLAMLTEPDKVAGAIERLIGAIA